MVGYYVPASEYTTYESILTTCEVVIAPYASRTALLQAAQAAALAARNTAETNLNSKFNNFIFVGA
jgi:hypothetical protein